MRLLPALALALATSCAASGAAAEGEPAGAFDYYVLALSWSPAWCALEGDARDADQCDPRHDWGFMLHGLWPQYEAGWPSFCRGGGEDPGRRALDAVRDITASASLARYQWEKHGRCSGLSGAAYLDAARHAFEAVEVPPALLALGDSVRIDAAVVEAAFVEANDGLGPDGITIACRGGHIAEVRICFTKDLAFRDCAPDVRRDCSGMTQLDPVR